MGPRVGLEFEDKFQQLYFEEWMYLSRDLLCGHSANKLWSTFLPQLTAQNTTLRDAALAIGAMSHAQATQSKSDSLYYQHAIAYYCRALRSVSRSNQGSRGLQEAILLSILFTSFEGVRQDVKSALRHVSHGLLIIRELCLGPEASSKMAQLAPSPGELIHEVILLYTRFIVQTQTVMSGTVQERNLHSRIIEEESNSEMDEREQLCAGLTPYMAPRAGLAWQPKLFHDADTAAEYWNATVRRVEMLDPSAVQFIDDLLLQDPRDYKNVEKYLQRLRNSPELHVFTNKVKTHLDIWHQAFWPLYQQTLAQCPGDSSSYLCLVNLRIEYLTMLIYSMFSEACNYEYVSSITLECRELLELCEILLQKRVANSKCFSTTFSMHTGLSWHLVFVAINCRDPIARETAIRILETYPRQDGLWSSQAFVEIAKKNRKIEAENYDEGTPQEQWQRLNRRVFLLEDAGDTLVFRYMRKVGNTGNWEFCEEYANLRSPSSQGKGLEWKDRSLSCEGCTLQWGRTADASSGTLWPGMGCSIPRIAAG
ncbi:unnamed protein product [Clonostachys rosea]|uniref:Transcription factor domain-containing protein n=1 Tax=Bionectria ochroleuca TaxID=29856 RepID=A0ABY6UFV3_BIOOC|nr:unnamed protein product [Clonostachys rosea]